MSDRSLRLAGGALVIVVGVWAGLRMYLDIEAQRRGGVATPVGKASPPTHSDMVDQLDLLDQPGLLPTKVPDRLPPFTLSGLDGKPVSSRQWDGRSLVLNFWATWCAPCRREIPMLKELSGAWANRGMTIVGVAVDHREAVSKFADEFKVSYPILVGEEDALDLAKDLGVETPVFPFTVFTDRQGEVVALYIGELHPAQASLILGVVETVNRNQLPLGQARRTISDGLKSLASQPG
jgi:thiol-disulfide isomerase/thioredoxin